MSGSDAKPLLPNATRDLATFAANLQYSDIPAEAVERIKYCVLDSIGCCIFGVTLPWTRHVQAMVQEEGAKQVASIFGGGGKTTISKRLLAEPDLSMSVSVTMPTSCLPFFTSSEPTRAVRIDLAALTMEVFGPIAFGRFVMICATVDMMDSFRRERDR